MRKVVPNTAPDATSLLRALKLSQLKQIETHQRLRKMKEQLINSLTTTKLITELQSYDVGLIEDLRNDLRESRQKESIATQKCEEAEKEIESLRSELETMKNAVVKLQRDLEIAQNTNGERSVTVLADKEVEDMLRRFQTMSKRYSARAVSPSFDSWAMGRFVEGYVVPTSPVKSPSRGTYEQDSPYDDNQLENENLHFIPSRGFTATFSLPRSAAKLRRSKSPAFTANSSEFGNSETLSALGLRSNPPMSRSKTASGSGTILPMTSPSVSQGIKKSPQTKVRKSLPSLHCTR